MLIFSQLTGADVARGVGEYEAAGLMRVYAVGFTAVFSIFALMYTHAYRLRNELELNPVEALQTRFAIQENIAMVIVGTVSFALTFRNPAWAGWWYFVLGPVLGIHGAMTGKRIRMLSEKLGLA
jgi:hypothetical protein